MFGLSSFDPFVFFLCFSLPPSVSDNTHTETLYHYSRAVFKLNCAETVPLAVCSQTPTATFQCQPIADHLPPVTQKSPPGESSVTEGRWREWDHTRGGGGLGAREAERGFRYINLSATVANHRLPLSHHSTLQPLAQLQCHVCHNKSAYALPHFQGNRVKCILALSPTSKEDGYYAITQTVITRHNPLYHDKIECMDTLI